MAASILEISFSRNANRDIMVGFSRSAGSHAVLLNSLLITHQHVNKYTQGHVRTYHIKPQCDLFVITQHNGVLNCQCKVFYVIVK